MPSTCTRLQRCRPDARRRPSHSLHKCSTGSRAHRLALLHPHLLRHSTLQPNPTSPSPPQRRRPRTCRQRLSLHPSEGADDPALAESDGRDDGPVRRSLIRAQFPRTEGQPPAPRAITEFTVHSLHNRNGRNGNGSHSHRGGGPPSSFRGPMRFGRDNGNGQPDGAGRPQGGQRHRRRRGGKKHQ